MKPTTVPFEGQKFRVLDDGSIVSESYAPTKTSNDFSLTAHVGTITAVRLDALTHPQLPTRWTGRSIDGRSVDGIQIADSTDRPRRPHRSTC